MQLKSGTLGKLTFGPVFMPKGYGKVMNDLTQEEMETTHREKAWRELIADIEKGRS